MEIWEKTRSNEALIEMNGADAVIVMFDVGRRITYDNVSSWISKVRPGVPIVVVGNKIDIADRKVKKEEVRVPYPYIEISSKTEQYVENVLYAINLTRMDMRQKSILSAVHNRTMDENDVLPQLQNMLSELQNIVSKLKQ